MTDPRRGMGDEAARRELAALECRTIEDGGGDFAQLLAARSLCVPVALSPGGVVLAVPAAAVPLGQPGPYSEAIPVSLAQEGSWDIASDELVDVCFLEVSTGAIRTSLRSVDTDNFQEGDLVTFGGSQVPVADALLAAWYERRERQAVAEVEDEASLPLGKGGGETGRSSPPRLRLPARRLGADRAAEAVQAGARGRARGRGAAGLAAPKARTKAELAARVAALEAELAAERGEGGRTSAHPAAGVGDLSLSPRGDGSPVGGESPGPFGLPTVGADAETAARLARALLGTGDAQGTAPTRGRPGAVPEGAATPAGRGSVPHAGRGAPAGAPPLRTKRPSDVQGAGGAAPASTGAEELLGRLVALLENRPASATGPPPEAFGLGAAGASSEEAYGLGFGPLLGASGADLGRSGSGAAGAVALERVRATRRSHPEVIVAASERATKEALGVLSGEAWTAGRYVREQVLPECGSFTTLKRALVALAAIVDEGRAHGGLRQRALAWHTLRVFEVAAMTPGHDLGFAWPLLGVADPAGRPEPALSPVEAAGLAAVHRDRLAQEAARTAVTKKAPPPKPPPKQGGGDRDGTGGESASGAPGAGRRALAKAAGAARASAGGSA